MDETRIWTLIARHLSGEISAEEAEELDQIISRQPDLADRILLLGRMRLRAGPGEEFATEKAFRRLRERIRDIEDRSGSPAGHSVRRQKKGSGSSGNIMISNYFKTAFRHIQKEKFFALIHITGLSVGIACFLLLVLFARNEFSFDTFHAHASEIYRPYLWERSMNGRPPMGYTDYSSGSESLAMGIRRLLPDVVNMARFLFPAGETLVRSGSTVIRVPFSFADPSFFSIFSFPLRSGSPATALNGLNSIVLTESLAKQFFGGRDPMGKTVEIRIGSEFQPFIVSAVAADVPGNSTIRFNLLGNYEYAIRHDRELRSGSLGYPLVGESFVQLKKGSRLPESPGRLAKFLTDFDPGLTDRLRSYGYTWQGDDLPVKVRLQPLLAIHTDSGFTAWRINDYEKINPRIIWVLLLIAAGILLIACINFTTMAIGQLTGRSREVGVRKVMGAVKAQIILQFLAESLLLAFFSAIIGFVLAQLFLPLLNQLAQRQITISATWLPSFLLVIVAVILLVGILSGFYPALLLAGLRPVNIFRRITRIGGSEIFSQSLVGLQFFISISLMASTLIIVEQTRYILHKNPGFDSANVISVDASEISYHLVFPRFREALAGNPSILGVASAVTGLGTGQEFLGYSDGSQNLYADINVIDTDYIHVMGMKLLAGSNFNDMNLRDTIRPIIINETLMRHLGWNLGNASGRIIPVFQGRRAKIIGVVQNFNYRPVGEEIKSQAFLASDGKEYQHYYVRIREGDPSSAIQALKRAWHAEAPGVPLKYSFVDENLRAYYQSEQRWSALMGAAGGISIFLSCLGLLGLTALAATRRTREIGIRKVLGASLIQLLGLLSKGFIRLLFLSFLAAVPITYLIMYRWLENYANRISISWWIFGFAGLTALLLALIAVIFQAMKTVRANPAKVLRTE